jgi:N-acetylmuramoyl-L-alanine amidase
MKYLRRFWALYLITAMIFTGLCMYGSEAVTAMVESLPIERSVTVVIDPGHGGEDGGAVSCTGHKESQINLSIALRLNDLLHLLGYDTVMIRNCDQSVHTGGNSIAQRKASDLKNRVRMVGEISNAVLISVHQNFFPESKYSGAQMFYNSHPKAKQMAQMLQKSFVSNINPGSNRKEKPVTGIYLLEHITAPGVLVECGFLSNPGEEARLRTAEYQKKIACVIASTLSGLDWQTIV